MIIGQLDRLIDVYSHQTTQNATGQAIKSRVFFARIYANVEYAASVEEIHADTTTSKTKIDFTIRYLSGLKESMEIKYENEYYEIIGIQPMGRSESMKVISQKMER